MLLPQIGAAPSVIAPALQRLAPLLSHLQVMSEDVHGSTAAQAAHVSDW